MESDRIGKKVTRLYEQLKNQANADTAQMAIGLIVFWPALLLLEGGDGPEAVEYRQLKGEYKALETISIQKECGYEFEDLDEKIKQKDAEIKKEKTKNRKRKN